MARLEHPARVDPERLVAEPGAGLPEPLAGDRVLAEGQQPVVCRPRVQGAAQCLRGAQILGEGLGDDEAMDLANSELRAMRSERRARQA